MKYLSILAVLTFLFVSGAEAQADTGPDLTGFLERKAPEVLAELKRLKSAAPDDYRETMAETVAAKSEYERVVAFSERGAEAYLQMYRLDFEAVWYSDEIAGSEDAAKSKELREELERLIADSFDQWIVYEQAKLDKLKADLATAGAQLEEHRRNKKEIVREDTEALIEEARVHLREASQ